MFQRSSAFSVQAALFSSKTTFKRHYPETTEDLFMLLHQNSLSAVAKWYTQLLHDPLDQSILLPQQLREALTFIEGGSAEDILKKYDVHCPERIGLQYGENDIIVLYNMTMRNHSSTFQVIYDIAQQQCRIEVQFLGESRNRWEQVALLAELSEGLSELHLNASVSFDKLAGIVSWSWIMESEHYATIFDYFGTMGRLSLTYGRDDITLDTLQQLYKGSNDQQLRVIRRVLDAYEHTKGSNEYTKSLIESISLNMN